MLENEYFVFTGTLTTMTRKQAQSIIIGLYLFSDIIGFLEGQIS